jgi:hypothetical protein
MNTPLIILALHGSKDGVDLLLKKSADASKINKVSKELIFGLGLTFFLKFGMTSLMAAIIGNEYHCVRVLCKVASALIHHKNHVCGFLICFLLLSLNFGILGRGYRSDYCRQICQL